MVPFAKRDAKERLYGDYKVTINPVIQKHKPLPRVKAIYSQKTAGGKRFRKIKIDFKKAYLEMEVEASKQYLTINTHNVLLRYDRLPFGIKTARHGQWNYSSER